MSNEQAAVPATPPPSPAEARQDSAGPHPGFTEVDVIEDFIWAYGEMASGRLDQFQGQHVAVVGRKILAIGPASMTFREEVAAKHGVDPERIAIAFIDDGSF